MECKGGEYIQAVWTSFEVILDVLHTVTNKADVKTKTQALGLKKNAFIGLRCCTDVRWPTTVTSKSKRSHQKQNARVKSKTLASKLSEHSEANASLRLFCSLAYGGRIFT